MDDPICPLDGRYSNITSELKKYFNEAAYFKYRIFVELQYFLKLISILPELKCYSHKIPTICQIVMKIYNDFDDESYNSIKQIEMETKHDVKAIEYYIRNHFEKNELNTGIPFIHFGLTSQDVNTTANMYCLKLGINESIIPCIEKILTKLDSFCTENKNSVMLSFTHGQPSVPTTMGKEFHVFLYRLKCQLYNLQKINYTTKFGGAIGNFNAHKLAYPNINWEKFSDNFIYETFGLKREQCTTQISNYDELCNILYLLKTINNIINDLNIDSWLYISKNYLKQRVVSTETGSSTMPHKVNPINFENSEGNICIANSLIDGITSRLNISRLQRDLKDSTILRNIGVILGYSLISYKSTLLGLEKINVNQEVLNKELDDNCVVLSEGIQTIMRKHGIVNAYEKMKDFTRGTNINNEKLNIFIKSLDDNVQEDLKELNFENYLGYQS